MKTAEQLSELKKESWFAYIFSCNESEPIDFDNKIELKIIEQGFEEYWKQRLTKIQ